ncbi:MAG: class I SAM-dependent methyltransferase [Betaproteobacteria bacterium]
MAVALQERWQLNGGEPESYEQYKVPRLFGPLTRLFLDPVPLRAGDRVLDVACGTGVVARLAASRVAPPGKVVGVDLNERMLGVARAHAPEDGVPIEWRQGDATQLPFADGMFEFVLCQQGLQFFPDHSRALREMHRVLAPGGMLALNVWGKASRYNVALAEALARYHDANTANRSLAPFALSDPQVVRTLVTDAGFGRIDMRTAVVTRRVQPSQEWLLQDTAGLPYASAIDGMDSIARAAMVREIGAKLKEFWDGDSFAVPTDVHLVYAKK